MTVAVVPSDLTKLGYIDAPAYLRWVQEVVILHWQRFAPPAVQVATLWVANKHDIRYRRPGRTGDHVIARTFLRHVKGVRAFFSTNILGDGDTLAQVESTWVCLDAHSRRPKILDQQVVDLFSDY